MRALLAAAIFFVGAGSAEAQAHRDALPPSVVEVVTRLRDDIRLSGLTVEQIRARLHGAGFRTDLLDDYLPSSPKKFVAPSEEVIVALREVGIASEADVAFYRSAEVPDPIGSPPAASSPTRTRRDSVLARRDTLTTAQAAADSARQREQRAPVADTLTVVPDARLVTRTDIADSIARADSGFTVFGLDVFRATSTSFDPVLFGPVDANYQLGPGDQLALILTGDVEETHSLEVSREGFVVIPRVGQLFVANLTLAQLNDLLYAHLGRVYSGVRRQGATTRFSVGVSRLRTNQVFVLGEVTRPGSYMISAAGTALSALYAAGGPTVHGSLRTVLIRRGGRVLAELDVYDYLLRGDASRDLRLQTGDIVFLPPAALRVRVVGEVVRPGTYEMKQGETLADVLRAAGGLRAEASRSRVHIERILPPGQRGGAGHDRITLDVAPGAAENELAATVAMAAGDVVRVFPIASRIRSTVTVMGNVWVPGAIGLTPGMTVGDAIRRAGGPKPDVYLGRVLISRLRPDSSRIQMRVALADTLGNVVNDIPLAEDDLIEVFSAADFRTNQYVTIGGAVRKPGRYPYREGMTMRDLILLADGLQESAYLREAEIARIPRNGVGAAAETVRVPLDSSFTQRQGATARASATRSEVVLAPYDNVLILQEPNWELQRVVTIEGEVAFPGSYALRSRTERLADLIKRAGGFTTEAYPAGATLHRRKGHVGRIAIDFPTAMDKERSADNLVLADGDRIVVPQRSFVVRVDGAVNAPNTVAYVPGASIAYYINQAGGVASSGDRRRAYVTQPNGKRQTTGWGRDPEPLAGSIITVPTAGPRTPFLQSISSVMTTIAGVVTTIILIENATRN